jgi:hypothetical protein
MRLPTFSHTTFARLFLLSLGVAGLYTVWSGTPPENFTFIPCLFHLITEIPCPGCGMTRACVALSQGQIAAAWGYHPFAFLVVGLAAGVAFFPVALQNAWSKLNPSTRNLLGIGGILLALGLWLYRLLSGCPIQS